MQCLHGQLCGEEGQLDPPVSAMRAFPRPKWRFERLRQPGVLENRDPIRTERPLQFALVPVREPAQLAVIVGGESLDIGGRDRLNQFHGQRGQVRHIKLVARERCRHVLDNGHTVEPADIDFTMTGRC